MQLIRPPTRAELPALRRIERQAGRAFLAIGMEAVASMPPPSLGELDEHRAAGRAFVAVDGEEQPVAYLQWSVVDGSAHVDQVSVAPSRARRGIGAALIDHLASRSLREGREAVTLTTFRDVPWNAPYYRRLGFELLAPGKQGPELASLLAAERTSIPGDAPRVAIRRRLTRGAARH